MSLAINTRLSALMKAQPPFFVEQSLKEKKRGWGPVAETQTDITTQKKTESVAFPITVSDFDMNQRGRVVVSISNPDLCFPSSFLQSSV